MRDTREQEIDPHPNPADRWKNRRRMAWIAMSCGCVYPIFALLTGSPHVAEIAWPFYSFIGLVVGAYVGFATVDDHWRRRPPRRSHDRFDF
jgi:hypothetical protein